LKRAWSPRDRSRCGLRVIGRDGAAASLVVTLSFLITTPHLDQAAQQLHHQGRDLARRSAVVGR
jgi:hypothetical protein